MAWLDRYFWGVIRHLGVDLPSRSVIEVTGEGVTAEDAILDDGRAVTRLTISGRGYEPDELPSAFPIDRRYDLVEVWSDDGDGILIRSKASVDEIVSMGAVEPSVFAMEVESDLEQSLQPAQADVHMVYATANASGDVLVRMPYQVGFMPRPGRRVRVTWIDAATSPNALKVVAGHSSALITDPATGATLEVATEYALGAPYWSVEWTLDSTSARWIVTAAIGAAGP